MARVQPYRSLKASLRTEIPRIKGSRFLADVCPIATADAAIQFVSQVRKREHSARHHAWAFRLAPEEQLTRSSDDGEPSGSAGKPILSALVGRDLYRVVAVVTRYFGGVKLGVGGLVRAYGGAAVAALDAAAVDEIVPKAAVRVVLPYDEVGRFEVFCGRLGLPRARLTYSHEVTGVLLLSAKEHRLFQSAVAESARGRWRVEMLGE